MRDRSCGRCASLFVSGALPLTLPCGFAAWAPPLPQREGDRAAMLLLRWRVQTLGESLANRGVLLRGFENRRELFEREPLVRDSFLGASPDSSSAGRSRAPRRWRLRRASDPRSPAMSAGPGRAQVETTEATRRTAPQRRTPVSIGACEPSEPATLVSKRSAISSVPALGRRTTRKIQESMSGGGERYHGAAAWRATMSTRACVKNETRRRRALVRQPSPSRRCAAGPSLSHKGRGEGVLVLGSRRRRREGVARSRVIPAKSRRESPAPTG